MTNNSTYRFKVVKQNKALPSDWSVSLSKATCKCFHCQLTFIFKATTKKRGGGGLVVFFLDWPATTTTAKIK